MTSMQHQEEEIFVVTVRLAEFKNIGFFSRTQAKRLLAGVDGFTHVILDFQRVDEMGQGFADQIFRIFVRDNPNIKLEAINTNETIKKMINHVKADN